MLNRAACINAGWQAYWNRARAPRWLKFWRRLRQPRELCYECGHVYTWREHIRHAWLMAAYKSGPYEKYFNNELLEKITQSLVFPELSKPRPFPTGFGAKTIRFKRPKKKAPAKRRLVTKKKRKVYGRRRRSTAN